MNNELNETFKSLVQLPNGGSQQLHLGDIQVLPEPATLALIATGLTLMPRLRRR